MLLRLALILYAFYPFIGHGQSVVLDVEYQPNTTYQWSRTLINDGSVEYLGAEDMGDWMDVMGVDPYSETKNTQYISVHMITSNWDNQKLPFALTIDSLNREVITTSARVSSFHNSDPLQIDDLEIYGVINHYQKIEIDSIAGVDSLHERNRVFRLLDEIHRSWSYPKDTFEIDQPIVKTSRYNQSVSGTSNASITSTYTLESVENGIAKLRMDYLVYTDMEDESGEIIDSEILEGKGTGLLLYDTYLKQVVLHEYTINVNKTINVSEIAVEAISNTAHRWTMRVVN